MRKSIPLMMALAAVPALAQAPSDKSYLAIFVETHNTVMAGQKMPKNMPDLSNLPDSVRSHLPPGAMAMMPGPHRNLNIRLWTPSIAPSDASASVAPPVGLKVGDKLDLQLYRPEPAQAGGGGGGAGGGQPGEHQDITIKIYWGSSPTVQPGQPKVFSTKDLTPELARGLDAHMRAMNPMGGMGHGGGGSYFYKDGWTTAYWPGDDGGTDISIDAQLPGTYSLASSYAGNVTIDAPADVNFLDPIEFSSPDLSQKPDLGSALAFAWKPIPNALGEFAAATGFEKDTNTLILWSSSEVYADQVMSDNGFLQMSEVQDAVQKQIFMPGTSAGMTIPAGIFRDAAGVMLSMVGYGPGSARDGVNPIPRIQTKTSTLVMLGGIKR